MSGLTRRVVLRGAGATLALPLLRVSTAAAQGMPVPTRLLVFFTPNGTNPETWYPSDGSTEDDFDLGPVLAPLEPFKQHLIVTRGIDMTSPERGPGEPHQKGMGCVLTGSHLQEGSFVGGDGTLAGWADGVSVDQVVAGHIGGDTRLSSLELGVRITGSEVRHRLNYASPANPLPPLEDPLLVHARLFADVGGGAETARLVRQRRSVLDTVYEQFRLVRRRASIADRRKLDAHAALVRDLERRLRVDAGPCLAPSAPPSLEVTDEDNMARLVRLQTDLLVAAFACDQTRVATLQLSSGANNIRFPHLRSYSDDHQLSHAGPSDTVSRQEWALRQVWYSEQLAYLLGRLRDVPEGDGTLLDHTLLLWVSDIAVGSTHSHEDMPFVLAGGAGGFLRTGRYLQFADAWHNELLLTVLHAFGVEADSFGDPDFVRGPLDTLRG